MPQPADMLNLSFLSEYEQELIMAVLQRDEELRRIEEKRVRSEESAVAATMRNALGVTPQSEIVLPNNWQLWGDLVCAQANTNRSIYH